MSEVKTFDYSTERNQQAEITFVGGDVDDAVNFVKQGWVVGMTAPLVEDQQSEPIMHMFHVGVDAQGQIVDLSDQVGSYARQVVDKNSSQPTFNDRVGKMVEQTRAKNIVLMRKKLRN